MREIRTFEMQSDEPATLWRVADPLIVEVAQGTLWLTVEGDAEDYWLEPGHSFFLPAGVRAWIGAGHGDVRMTATDAGPLGAAFDKATLASAGAEPVTGRTPSIEMPRWRLAAA